MMHKLLTLALILGFTAACETTHEGRRYEEPVSRQTSTLTNEEQRAIDACAYGNSQACINLSVDAYKRGLDITAIELAEVACAQGSQKGCNLRDDLVRFAREALDSRQQRRQQQRAAQDQADRDVQLINLMNQSAGQMGTVTVPPTPQRTRCISKWNPYLKQQESVCEQE